MGDSVMVWFAVAVLLFWSMGAYNRLVRFRSQGIAAFSVLEGLFNQHVLLVKNSIPDAGAVDAIPDMSQGHDTARATWIGLAAAAEQFNACLKVVQAQPLNGPKMSALRTAYETLCLSWCRLRDLSSDPGAPGLPSTLQPQWERLDLQTEIARTEFNRRIENYNEAIKQFPALMLAWLFGFKLAQPI